MTKGSKGHLEAALDPIEARYENTCTDLGCMCPVNVHWHLGAEHLNVGTYDVNGGMSENLENKMEKFENTIDKFDNMQRKLEKWEGVS